MKTWQPILFAVLCTLLVTGVIYLVSRPARGVPIQLIPAPTPAPLVVHVSGAVLQPGVYRLPSGSRWSDAVQAAGGLSPEADAGLVNLAAPLSDGSLLVIPSLIDLSATSPSDPSPTRSAQLPRSGSIVISDLIDINTALAADFEDLPEIGPVIAQRIVEYRDAHGPFTTLEAIQNVSGIGPVTFEKIKPLITLSSLP